MLEHSPGIYTSLVIVVNRGLHSRPLIFIFSSAPYSKAFKERSLFKNIFLFHLVNVICQHISICMFSVTSLLKTSVFVFLFFCLFILPFHLTYNSLSMLMLLYILFTVIYADTLLVSSIFIVFYL